MIISEFEATVCYALCVRVTEKNIAAKINTQRDLQSIHTGES